MGQRKARRIYSAAFKQEAVALVLEHGVSAKQAAMDLGVPQSTLQLWLQKAQGDRSAANAEPITSTEREELKRLRKEVRILKEERGLLRQGDAVSCYRFIEAEKANHAVTLLCRAVGVSRSGYYDWRRRKPSQRALANARLTIEIRSIFREHKGRLGKPRLRPLLSEPTSKKRVARIMRENGLVARPRRKFVRTTRADPRSPKAPNRLDRQFTTNAPNVTWVEDITYIPTREGWLYLAVLLDLYSRAVVAGGYRRGSMRRS